MATDTDRPAKALYLAALWLGSLMALVLFTIERVKYPVADFLARGSAKAGLPRFLLEQLTAIDFVLVTVAAVLAIALLYVEVRHGAVSAGLMQAPRRAFAVLVAAFLAWYAHAYLHPGILLGGDTAFHIARIHHFRLGLERGFLLFWDNYFDLGVPELQFTGPLLFWTGGILDYLLGDPYLAAKALLFVLHAGAGWVMYRLLRMHGLSSFAALVGTSCYAGAFVYHYLMLYRGVLPQAFTLLLLPAGFLLAERVALRNDHASPWWAALAVVGALIMINHPSNGMFVGLYMAFMIVASLIAGRYPWQRLVALGTAGALSVAMMAFILVPVLAERSWVTMNDTDSLFSLHLPDGLFWRRILIWSNSEGGMGGNFDAYLGASAVCMAIIGVWVAWRRPESAVDWKFFRIASVLLLPALVLTGPHIRTIMFMMFFVSLLAGVGAHYLQAHFRRRHVPALIVAILFVDLGSTAIQPLARTDKGHIAAAAQYLVDKYPNERVIEASSRGQRLSIPIWGANLLVYPVQQLGSTFSYSCTLFHNYGAAIAKNAERDLNKDDRLSPSSEHLLAMLNFSRIVTDNGREMNTPQRIVSAVAEGPLGRVVAVRGASPIVLAPSLMLRKPEPAFDKPVFWNDYFEEPPLPVTQQVSRFVENILKDMGYDKATRVAAAIPVRELPPQYAAAVDESRAPWSHRIVSYQVEMSRVRLRLESDRAGYVQLAHTWYPSQQVRHNGQIVQSIQGTLSLLVLPVLAGGNDYEIVPVRTKLRIVLEALSALIFLLVAGFGIGNAIRAARSSA